MLLIQSKNRYLYCWKKQTIIITITIKNMNPVNNRFAVLLLISAISYIAIHFIFGFSNYFAYKFLAIAILTVLASFAYLVESYKEYRKNTKELKEAKRILKANPTAEDVYFKDFYNRI